MQPFPTAFLIYWGQTLYNCLNNSFRVNKYIVTIIYTVNRTSIVPVDYCPCGFAIHRGVIAGLRPARIKNPQLVTRGLQIPENERIIKSGIANSRGDSRQGIQTTRQHDGIVSDI